MSHRSDSETRPRQRATARTHGGTGWLSAGTAGLIALASGCRSLAPPSSSVEPARIDPPAEALARLGRSLLHEYRGEYDAAIEQVIAAVAADPDSEHLNGRAATLLIRRGRFEEAKELIERWIERKPDDSVRLRWLARVHREAGRYEEAAEAYRRALGANPSDAESVAEYVGLLLLRDAGDAAREVLREASATARPVRPLLRAAQEYLTWVEGRRQVEAREKLAEVLGTIGARFDLEAEDRLALGHLYRRMERADDAYAAFERAAALAPDNEQAVLFAALMKAAAGQEDEALAIAERSVDRVRQPLNLLRLIAELHARAAARASDPDRARQDRLAAAAALRRVLAARPDDRMVRMALGELLLLAGQTEEALTELRHLVAAEPALARIIALRLATVGDGSVAIGHVKSLAEAHPRDSHLWYLLGELHLRVGERQQAIAAFRAATSGDDLDPVYFLRLAAALAFDEPDAAMEILREAERRWPREANVIEMRAQMHLLRGEAAEALAAYDEIERSFPAGTNRAELPLAFWIRSAAARIRAGDTGGAGARLRQAMATDPLAIEGFIRLTADPSLPAEEIERARAVLRELDGARQDVLICLFRGLFEHFVENYAEAIAAFETAMERSRARPAEAELLTPDFYFWFGAALERAGQIERAEDMLLKCLERDPHHHRALNYLAYTWADRGLHLEKALDFVQRALHHEPDNAAYIDTLGWIYFRMGRFEDALAELRRALEKESEEAEIQDHVGEACAALGRMDEAIEHWKKAFVLSPENTRLREKLERHGVDVAPLLEAAAERRREAERRRRWRWLIGDEGEEMETPDMEDATTIPGLDMDGEELDDLQENPPE